jgi:hypothetical protein
MMVARLRGGLELLIKLANDEELKMDVDSGITVGRLKEMIAKRNSILGKESMCLTCAGIVFKDEKKLLKDLIPKSVATIV